MGLGRDPEPKEPRSIFWHIYDYVRAYTLGFYDCWKYRKEKKNG